MKKVISIACVIGLAVVTGHVDAGTASPARDQATRYTATMTPRQVVTPTNKPWRIPASLVRAKATFTGTISSDRRKLTWRISYSDLGPSSTVIADIHIGKPGKFGPVLVRLCSDCRPVQSGVKRLKRDQAQQIALGNTWVTLITPKYPNGVVRGQIKVQ